MEKKYSDEKAVELIFEMLQKLKRGEISFEGFAVGVALVIDPVPLTEKDFEWAREKAVSLGLESLLTQRAADAGTDLVDPEEFDEYDDPRYGGF